MLALENVSAGYGGPDVVKNVSITIKDGESLSIIGPNGCGKTTLLKAIARLLPSSGEIKLDGASLHSMKHKDAMRKIAMLSQTSGIYFTYSVFDTVMMGRYLHIKDKFLGLPSDKDREVVSQCLEAVNMSSDRDKEITKLSGGQLQRVFLARALAQEPQIILLDEPTNHLDLKYQIELIEYLKNWASKNSRSVIGVLHDINLAMRLSDNIMVMKDGQIQAIGIAGNVVTGELLESVYDVDVVGYMRDSLKIWEALK